MSHGTAEREAEALRVIRLFRTLRADEHADFAWRGEDNRCPVALHAGAHDDGFSWSRPELARIRLEAQIEFPDPVYFTVRRFHRVSVSTVADRRHLALRRRLFQVLLGRLHIHHHAPALLRLFLCLFFSSRFLI